MKVEKNYSSYHNIDLPIIPRIINSNVEDYKNKNKVNNTNNNYNNVNKNGSESTSKYKIRNDLKKLNMSASCSRIKKIENNKNVMDKNKMKLYYHNNCKSYFNMYSKYILKNINILKLKKQLTTKMDLLENQVNNSTKFISNGSKINEEEKPQFKYRFKNLKNNFNQYLDNNNKL